MSTILLLQVSKPLLLLGVWICSNYAVFLYIYMPMAPKCLSSFNLGNMIFAEQFKLLSSMLHTFMQPPLAICCLLPKFCLQHPLLKHSPSMTTKSHIHTSNEYYLHFIHEKCLTSNKCLLN